jgi:hypothetical protein
MGSWEFEDDRGKKAAGWLLRASLLLRGPCSPPGVARRPEPPGIKPGQGYFVAGGNPLARFVIWALAVYRSNDLGISQSCS